MAALIRSYNTKLMSDDIVRRLVRSVAQDPKTETVSYSQSRFTIDPCIQNIGGLQNVQTARRAIIAWLNDVYFTNLDKPLPVNWWWEMGARLHKLLTVSMFLEGRNLESFGVETLQLTDIPQCLIGVYSALQNAQQDFSHLEEAYLKTVSTMYEKTGEPDHYFVSLYLNGEKK